MAYTFEDKSSLGLKPIAIGLGLAASIGFGACYWFNSHAPQTDDNGAPITAPITGAQPGASITPAVPKPAHSHA
jgi:hypothetical protein